jgi:hypothetical protein
LEWTGRQEAEGGEEKASHKHVENTSWMHISITLRTREPSTTYVRRTIPRPKRVYKWIEGISSLLCCLFSFSLAWCEIRGRGILTVTGVDSNRDVCTYIPTWYHDRNGWIFDIICSMWNHHHGLKRIDRERCWVSNVKYGKTGKQFIEPESLSSRRGES